MGKCIVLAVAIASLAPRSASAERYWSHVPYYPWCAFYDEWTYECTFMTVTQCAETIRGVGGICRPNPYPAPAPPRYRRRR